MGRMGDQIRTWTGLRPNSWRWNASHYRRRARILRPCEIRQMKFFDLLGGSCVLSSSLKALQSVDATRFGAHDTLNRRRIIEAGAIGGDAHAERGRASTDALVGHGSCPTPTCCCAQYAIVAR